MKGWDRRATYDPNFMAMIDKSKRRKMEAARRLRFRSKFHRCFKCGTTIINRGAYCKPCQREYDVDRKVERILKEIYGTSKTFTQETKSYRHNHHTDTSEGDRLQKAL